MEKLPQDGLPGKVKLFFWLFKTNHTLSFSLITRYGTLSLKISKNRFHQATYLAVDCLPDPVHERAHVGGDYGQILPAWPDAM